MWNLLQHQWMYLPHLIYCVANFLMLILIDAPRNDVLRTSQIKGFLITYLICSLAYLWTLMQMITGDDDDPPSFKIEYMFVHMLIQGSILSHSMFHVIAEISGSFYIAFVMFLQEAFQWILLVCFLEISGIDFKICFAIGAFVLWMINSFKMFMTGADITVYGKSTQVTLFTVRWFVLLFWVVIFSLDTNYYFILCLFVIGEATMLVFYGISFIKT